MREEGCGLRRALGWGCPRRRPFGDLWFPHPLHTGGSSLNLPLDETLLAARDFLRDGQRPRITPLSLACFPLQHLDVA